MQILWIWHNFIEIIIVVLIWRGFWNDRKVWVKQTAKNQYVFKRNEKAVIGIIGNLCKYKIYVL